MIQENAVVAIAAVSLLLFLVLMGVARGTSASGADASSTKGGSSKPKSPARKSPKKGSVSTSSRNPNPGTTYYPARPRLFAARAPFALARSFYRGAVMIVIWRHGD